MKKIVIIQALVFANIFFELLPLASKASEVDFFGVTKTEVVLGQSAAFTGPSAALGTELWRGAEAYFSEINASGGINGRKIKVLAEDDKYDGDLTIKNTLDLITKQKVFGLFGYVGTPTIVKALPVLQRFQTEKIFLFSNFTGSEPQRSPPHDAYVFNVRSSYRDETKGLVTNFLKIGFKKIGVFIQDDAYGRSGADGVARALKSEGLTIAAEATYQRGVPFSSDMAPQVNILKKAGVDVVISVGSYAAWTAGV